MRVLLLHPPDEMEAMLGEGRAFVQKYEPLGLLYIAAVARRAGHDVAVIDAHAQGLSPEEIQRRLLASPPEVVGISTLTCSGAIVYDLGRWIKARLPGVRVVLGNVHASVYWRSYLEHGCCDAVVHGEGEQAFLGVLERLGRGESPAGLPGVSARAGDGRLVEGAPALVEDLSRLPLPARDMVDRRRYRLDEISNQIYVGKARSTSMTMCTSRGCRYKCTFCVVNQRPRFNAPELVADEMEMLEKEYGASYVLIIDPLCMYDSERMQRICALASRRRLSIRWGCDARVSCITPELVRAMDGANCHDLSFGIESGVQRLLNAVKKGTTLDQIRRAAAVVREHSDIRMGGLFILGLPGETYRDSLETIRFAKSLPLDMAQFSLLTPYPGSAVFEELRVRGALDTGERPGGGLDTSVWRRYSAYISFTDKEPIWVTPEQTARQLRALQKRAQREFYLRPSQVLRHLGRLRPGNALRWLRIARTAFV